MHRVYGLTLKFYTNRQIDEKIKGEKDPGILLISFDKDIATNDLLELTKDYNGKWNLNTENYFKTMKIKDLMLGVYDFKKKWTREELDKKFPIKKGN